MEMSSISVFTVQDQTQSQLSVVRSGKNSTKLTQSEKTEANATIVTISKLVMERGATERHEEHERNMKTALSNCSAMSSCHKVSS